MGKKFRHSLRWIVVVFFVGAVLANGYLLGYVGGQINQPLPLMFLLIAVSCLGLPLFVVAIGLLIFGLCRRNRGDAVNTICILPAALMVGMVAGYISPAFVESPTVTFLRGFEGWVNRNVDTDAVQKWIATNESYWPTSDDENGKFYDTRREELPDELPGCFRKFKIQSVYFKRSELGSSRIVEFRWGGGMWHWGVVIGDPNMVMPESGWEEISDGFWKYRRVIKAHVYIYSDG